MVVVLRCTRGLNEGRVNFRRGKGSHDAVPHRREALREAVRVEVVGEGESSSVKLGPAGGRLGEWRRWLGEGRQVVGRLCEEVERLPARSIEEWRAEEPDSFGMGLSAEMVRAVAFTHCFGSNGCDEGWQGLRRTEELARARLV